MTAVPREAARFVPHADRGDGVMHPLDLACAFLRRRGGVVVGRYAVAMTPMLAAAWLWIDAVSAQDRLALRGVSGLVVAALLWRWVWLVAVQAAVMRDAGLAVHITWRRAAVAVLARLLAHAAVVWGGLLILPGLVGFYFGSFVTVLLLRAEPGQPAGAALSATLRTTWQNLVTLWRHTVVLLALTALWALTAVMVSTMVIGLLLPSLLNINTTDVQLAMRGPAWWLSLGLLGFVVLDLFWQVAAVFTVLQLEARRGGDDLFAQLSAMREQDAAGSEDRP